MKKILLCLTIALGSTVASAQPGMVRDINPGTPSSNPSWFTEYNGMLMFAANDGTNGSELWMLDSAGTSLVYNINPGSLGSISYSTTAKMVVIDNMLYFVASDGTNGSELYKWSGSGQPSIVKDIRTGAAGSNITELALMNGRLFFGAFGDNGGNELWVYDPVSDNAQQLADIYSGSGSSNPNNFAVFKGKLYFAAYAPGIGYELYMYDPSNNSTSLASDLYNGSGSSYPGDFMIWNDKLYFTAMTPQYGREIYVMENTTPVRITDVNQGGSTGVLSSSGGATMTVWNGMIYFTGNDGSSDYQLFKYDPSNGTTSLVYKINPLSNSYPYGYTHYANKMYFVATDGQHGNELWMYDGTNAPAMVADIWMGSNNSQPYNLMVYNETLYFSAMDSATGRELYKIYDSAVGIQNVRFEADIKVYPNPTTSLTYIDIDLKNSEQLAIRMVDAAGRVVYQNDMKQYQAGSNKIAISMEHLTPGVYYYNVIGGDSAGYFAGRILKQ